MKKDLEINRKEKLYRLFEILPGFLTWSAFILPIIFSLFWPYLVASFVIIYAVYWLAKAIVMSFRLVIAYFRYTRSIEINWLGLCGESVPKGQWRKIYHLVILATYKEKLETLRHSVRALVDSNYPLDRMIFVLATEERDREQAHQHADILRKEFAHKFHHFMITEHPKRIIGEVKGKGSNITYAGKQAKRYIQQQKIPFENVLVTSLDADNRVHPKYLACLTHHYLTTPNPLHKSFQPLPMFFNNIWQVPLFIRSISVGGSFWQMIESTRPYRMRNFSAHAQSLAALIETDFWSTKTIVEDGHQFWRSYFAFNGNHQVVPLFVPVYQDAVLSPRGYRATFAEQYIQKRRWAWGCSDVPYVLTRVIKNKRLPFWDKWLQVFRLVEGHFSWSTTSILLAVVGWMPLLLNPDFRSTVLAYNFPLIYSRILTIAMFGLIVTLIISTLLLPPRPKKTLVWSVILEWIVSPIMLPLSNIIFGSFAAIDAQTHLMLGKYLGFKVTEKATHYD